MKPETIHYDDWGHFIQMDKSQWAKVKRWLKAHGVEISNAEGDGRVTKYRKVQKRKA